MRVEYINPFIKALSNTFSTMLNCEVTRGEIELKSKSTLRHPISGIIGLTGAAVGTVVINLSEDLALKATSALLMVETTEVNDDVIDAVGELANMIAGPAKSELEEYDLSISLPNVVIGTDHNIGFPSSVTPICVPFDTQWGQLMMEVGLSAVGQPVA